MIKQQTIQLIDDLKATCQTYGELGEEESALAQCFMDIAASCARKRATEQLDAHLKELGYVLK